MRIRFYIHYKTTPGQGIYVCGSADFLGNWNPEQALPLNYAFDGEWSTEKEIQEDLPSIDYKYLLKDQKGNIIWEWGKNRNLDTGRYNKPDILLHEHWRSPSNEAKVMYSSAFQKAIMKPGKTLKAGYSTAKKVLEFRIQVPRIGTQYQLCVMGNHARLGNWSKTKPLLMGSHDHFPEWSASVSLQGFTMPVEYKYGIYDIRQGEVVTLEEGDNRRIDHLPESSSDFVHIRSDESFRYPLGNWKGAGVSVPVFSLRSERGFGVGDFTDLIDFIDWAKETGMKMVQILPVNETISSHNWLDSYPYKSISVMALHPIYMDIDKLGILEDKKLTKEFEVIKQELNGKTYVDYPEVLRHKSRYFKLIYDQQKETFFESEEFKSFFKENRDWLVPYAAFVYLRDQMKSADFRVWKKFSSYDAAAIEKMSTPGTPEWDDIAVHYYIQFHLDKQLREVAGYARKNGIVLKGDIPIGISPNSVEAWTLPHLFHLDVQAGAPPDAFALKGQNWGFPTYNWETMASDGYQWWRARLKKMADYFDAYRIDHILGFFRIWEIPSDAVEGVLGYFNPALPMSADEIREYGVHFDYERMVRPYIRHHLLPDLFGEFTEEVISKYLAPDGYEIYRLKKEFNTQAKINRHFLDGTVEEEMDDKTNRTRRMAPQDIHS
ncbi:MAG: 4-alpha-glucanotransferase [bacterium]